MNVMAKQDKINHDDKPVGYGSSIQSSGNGNKNRPQKQVDKKEGLNQNTTTEESVKQGK